MKTLEVLEGLTEILVQSNVAAPIIFGLVTVVANAIKGVTGSGPSLTEIADMLEAKIGQNDVNIRAEIERMKQITGEQ